MSSSFDHVASPSGISQGPLTGRLFVTDFGKHQVLVFFSNGTFSHRWGREGRGDGQFAQVMGLVAWGECNSSKLLETMYTVIEFSLFPPGIIPICGAYLEEECVAVADPGNHRIQIFACEGAFIRKWGRCGRNAGELHGPLEVGIKRGKDTRLGVVDSFVVLDSQGRRIQVFDSDGAYIYSIPTKTGMIDGHFGMAVHPVSGMTTVIIHGDHNGKTVQVFPCLCNKNSSKAGVAANSSSNFSVARVGTNSSKAGVDPNPNSLRFEVKVQLGIYAAENPIAYGNDRLYFMDIELIKHRLKLVVRIVRFAADFRSKPQVLQIISEEKVVLDEVEDPNSMLSILFDIKKQKAMAYVFEKKTHKVIGWELDKLSV